MKDKTTTTQDFKLCGKRLTLRARAAKAFKGFQPFKRNKRLLPCKSCGVVPWVSALHQTPNLTDMERWCMSKAEQNRALGPLKYFHFVCHCKSFMDEKGRPEWGESYRYFADNPAAMLKKWNDLNDPSRFIIHHLRR